MRGGRSILSASVVVSLVAAAMASAPVGAGGSDGSTFLPGAPGIGDPYFPLDGNGGYDVSRYHLDVAYDPATDVLTAEVAIKATATQGLSSFNLDFEGLTIRSITVDGRAARWTRDGGELTVTPSRGIRQRHSFTTVVRYDGVPETIADDDFSESGFIHTSEGALVAGQPDSAATWFPVNDHPSDRASYTFEITVPAELEAIANGELKGRRTHRGSTTWTWEAREPMAPYLAMMAIGEFDVSAYRADGVRIWDAIDPALDVTEFPRTGEHFAISQAANLTYKRLARTISVGAAGAQLSFWVERDTEFAWDFLFVEAHTVGEDDWTTLPDENGHTRQDTGASCPFWLGLHPFLEHYQTPIDGDVGCDPTGTTGEWWASTGPSDGFEEWSVDLSAYAGTDVEVSITYASDDIIQGRGAFVDDIDVSTGEGTTSFEEDGDVFDGWTTPGAPEGSEPNANDWIVGTADDTPPSKAEVAAGSFARLPEMLDFMSEQFGRYPFSTGGGIVDDVDVLGFALETQTRPVYAESFFSDPISGDSVVVHENAHQWFGDSLVIERWQHIWLNEGFATYAEWLWSEREGLGTPQELFDFYYEVIPEDDPFWAVTIGDPGPIELFSIAIYWRGAMTLQALRNEVGDRDFFRILRTWVRQQSGGTVTTDEFISLAERISRQDLDELFDAWLFTPGRPDVVTIAASSDRTVASASSSVPVAAKPLLAALD